MAKNSLDDQTIIVNLSNVQVRFAHTIQEQQYLTKRGYQLVQPMVKPLTAPPPLTTQQRRCLALLQQHKNVKTIARTMRLSETTVNQHLAALRRKFKCDTNTALVLKANETLLD